MHTITFILFSGVIFANICSGAPPKQYPLKLQPEFDRFDIASIFKNDKVMRLQFKCLMFDAPCDIFGRFVKPRAKGALMGMCEKCTPLQEMLMSDWFAIFKNNFPEMHKLAVKKFIDNDGKELSEEDKAELKKVFSDDAITNYLKVYKEFANTLPNPNNPNVRTTAATTTTTTTTTTTETPTSSSASTNATTSATPTTTPTPESEATTTPAN